MKVNLCSATAFAIVPQIIQSSDDSYALCPSAQPDLIVNSRQEAGISNLTGAIMRTPLHPDMIDAIQKFVEKEAEELQLSLDHPYIVRVKADLLTIAEQAA